MLGFYETEKRIKTQMRLEKGRVHKSVLVFASDQKSRKMINIYLKLYGYEEVCVQIIRKVDPADMGEIVRMIDQHHPQEVIVLYAGEFSWSIELQHYFFDRILERGVNITSIYDRLTVHADQYYLRMIEKRELISRSMLQKREDSREQIKRSMLNDNRGKRVAAYLRVSSREQTLGYSIENQREKISMYLELFEYEDVKIDFFVDSGRSASSLKRPQLQEMLKRIKNDEYDELFNQLSTTFDEDARRDIIQRMQQILIDDAVVIVHGYYNSSMISRNATIGGAAIHTADYYWLTTEIYPAAE